MQVVETMLLWKHPYSLLFGSRQLNLNPCIKSFLERLLVTKLDRSSLVGMNRDGVTANEVGSTCEGFTLISLNGQHTTNSRTKDSMLQNLVFHALIHHHST